MLRLAGLVICVQMKGDNAASGARPPVARRGYENVAIAAHRQMTHLPKTFGHDAGMKARRELQPIGLIRQGRQGHHGKSKRRGNDLHKAPWRLRPGRSYPWPMRFGKFSGT